MNSFKDQSVNRIFGATIHSPEAVNLNNCDREPIHIPGLIQPHGLLLVLREPGLQIVQASENTVEILGIHPDELPNLSLLDLLGANQIEAIQACLDRSFEHINPLPLTLTVKAGASFSMNGIVHRAPGGEVVLELEPAERKARSDFFQFHRLTKDILTKMQLAQSLADLCDLVVEEVQRLTGFDRVMIYRFNQQGDGTVIAEAKQPEAEPFLGLRYPDSDIPKQAKYLYTLNWLRLIPDIQYQPAGLRSFLPSTSEPAQQPLDMSYCVLRAVSPIHIEYLKNMGVAASMSVSLIQQQRLWGLIACHHNSPKFVPYETRTICEFLGQLMSTELANKEANEDLDYKLQLKDIQGRLVDRLAGATDFATELTLEPTTLLQLMGAQGVVVCEGDQLIRVGATPTEADILALIPWLADQFERDLFVTNALPRLYPEAEAYKQVGSGLLALCISKIQRRYILWFRPEIVQTVAWAGNPEKPSRIEADGSLTIFPRQSFEAWQEIVRGKSSDWLACEVEGAVELRQAIVDIVLRQADELASINLELERSNTELDAFAYIASHDLKEPLRGIHNYATFLLEDYENILEAEGVEKLQTLVRLTKRMELLIESLLKFSRLGRQELQMKQIDLNQLLHDTIEIFHMNPQWAECAIRIPRPLPIVWGDRTLIEEIFTNLITNAFKYNDQPEKWVELGWLESPEQTGEVGHSMTTLYVRDNGIGIREKHLDSIFRIFKRLHAPGKYGGGAGAGLTIVKKIVERHGGMIKVESTYGQGTTFLFTLPISSPHSASTLDSSPI